MATVQVRYIVHDVDAAIAFYCGQLGFHEVMHPAPAFAMLTRGDLRLVLSAPNPASGGGQPMPDGRRQEPGGWNRFAIEVADGLHLPRAGREEMRRVTGTQAFDYSVMSKSMLRFVAWYPALSTAVITRRYLPGDRSLTFTLIPTGIIVLPS